MNKCSHTIETNLLCKHYLSLIYQQIQPPAKLIISKKNITQTNGEILFEDKTKLFKLIKLNKHDILYDLGSGAGKIILHAFLQTPIKKAVGIEIRSDLYQEAMLAAAIMQKDFPELFHQLHQLEFQLGSFFDISFDEATIIIINATCYSQPMLFNIGQHINQSPNTRCIVSLRPILNLTRLSLNQIIKIQCSWDSVLAYIYMR